MRQMGATKVLIFNRTVPNLETPGKETLSLLRHYIKIIKSQASRAQDLASEFGFEAMKTVFLSTLGWQNRQLFQQLRGMRRFGCVELS